MAAPVAAVCAAGPVQVLAEKTRIAVRVRPCRGWAPDHQIGADSLIRDPNGYGS
jgi:hypothetical protein